MGFHIKWLIKFLLFDIQVFQHGDQGSHECEDKFLVRYIGIEIFKIQLLQLRKVQLKFIRCMGELLKGKISILPISADADKTDFLFFIGDGQDIFFHTAVAHSKLNGVMELV